MFTLNFVDFSKVQHDERGMALCKKNPVIGSMFSYLACLGWFINVCSLQVGVECVVMQTNSQLGTCRLTRVFDHY